LFPCICNARRALRRKGFFFLFLLVGGAVERLAKTQISWDNLTTEPTNIAESIYVGYPTTGLPHDQVLGAFMTVISRPPFKT